MNARLKHIWMMLLALLLTVSVAHAQSMQPTQAQARVFVQEELDQMLAPIALYPDALLSQLLMAATYPNEVIEAANWSRANPGYKGDAAVKAVENQPWDISVKSLLAFPNVLSTMSSKIDWTERLGQAFQGQQQQVMDTIQRLRQKAMQSGYLRSDNHVRVVTQDQYIMIEPVTPTAVYVPYYNPLIVYGTWWAPAYAPVYWSPWPGYAVAPGYYGWYWSPVATVVTAGLLFAAFNWHHHHAYYHHHHYRYWSGHRHSHHHYFSGRTSGTTRWTRDVRKPVRPVRTFRGTTGTRTVKGTTGTRTVRGTTGTRTVRGTTGTRTVKGTTGTRTMKSGGSPTGGRTGGARSSGGRAGGGGGHHKSGH